MTGQITTCYSFKGGSGRSMSLANVAWAMATRGQRVLIIDWDLEAPGVHRYFHPFLADPLQQDSPGLIEGLWAYVNAIPEGAIRKQAEWAAMDEYIQRMELPLRGEGSISLLGAGIQDEKYTNKVSNFDWATFYSRMGGKGFIDLVGRWARNNYDHILIDSRTGVSDTAGICTMQLPDVLALFFVYNRQSIEGTAAAGNWVRNAAAKKVRIIACPSRVEDRKMAMPARQYAALCFEEVLGETSDSLMRKLRVDEMMHFSWCAYEEKLAVFEEEEDEQGTLLKATEALSYRIAKDLPAEYESVEKETMAAYWRRAAFRDPRLDELEGLRAGSLSQKLPLLKIWIAETLQETATSLVWKMALATECAALIGSAHGVLTPPDAEALGHGAFRLARSALEQRGADPAAVAEIYRARALQLLSQSRLEEALQLVDETVALVADRNFPAARQVLIRTLELRADIVRPLSGPAQAIETLDRLVALLESTPAKTSAPLHDARGRALRLRAAALLDLGRYEEAAAQAERAFRIAKLGNAPAEAGLARLVWVKAELATGHADAPKTVQRMQRWLARQDMPDTFKHELEVRMALALVEYHRAYGDIGHAREMLDAMDQGLPVWAAAEVAELRARIDLPGRADSGKPSRTLKAGADESTALATLRLALEKASDEGTKRRVILDFLNDGRLSPPGDARSESATEAPQIFFDLIHRLLVRTDSGSVD